MSQDSAVINKLRKSSLQVEETIIDPASGDFTFYNVTAGSYLIITLVNGIPVSVSPITVPESGALSLKCVVTTNGVSGTVEILPTGSVSELGEGENSCNAEDQTLQNGSQMAKAENIEAAGKDVCDVIEMRLSGMALVWVGVE